MPQAPDSEIPYNRPRRRRSSRGAHRRQGQERRRPTRQDALIERVREIIAEPLEAPSSPGAAPGAPGRDRFRTFPNVADLPFLPSGIGPLVVGLGIVALLAVIGPFLQNRVEEAATRATPVIRSIHFPKQVPIDGRKHAGTIRFRDREGDIVKVSYEYLKPRRSGPFIYDLSVRGRTAGSFSFSLQCTYPVSIVLRVKLIDAKGHQSAPYDVPFRCVATR